MEWTDNGLKIALDPEWLNGLWQAILSWGWIAAGGLVMLAAAGFNRILEQSCGCEYNADIKKLTGLLSPFVKVSQ